MKNIILILSLLFSVSIFGQSKNWDLKYIDSILPNNKFIVDDTIMICDGCEIDYFNNLINSEKDTVAKNVKYLHIKENPLCFTNKNVLLTTTTAKLLFKNDKVENFTIETFSNGRNLFGDLAKNGVIILELKNKNLESEYLLDILKRSNPGKNISIEKILINGLETQDKKIKYFGWAKLTLDFNTKTNTYNIKTE